MGRGAPVEGGHGGLDNGGVAVTLIGAMANGMPVIAGYTDTLTVIPTRLEAQDPLLES